MYWPIPFGHSEGFNIQKRPDPLEEIVRNSRPNVLVLTPDYTSIAEALEELRKSYNLSVVTDFQEASKRLEENPFHLILTSVRLNGHTSTEVVRLVKEKSPYTKVLVLGGENGEDKSIVAESINEGAHSQIKRPYDKGVLETEVINTIGKSPPFSIVVGGHFCVGKTKFSSGLVDALNIPTNLAEQLIPFKSRDPRAYERVSVDYKQIPPEELKRLVQRGEVIPYKHGDNGENGISLSFLDTLREGRSVVIPTDINAMMALKTYFKEHKLEYRIISFLLHCHENDARVRLFAKERYTPRQVREIANDLNKLVKETEYYREHAGEFKHVLRNDNIPGLTPEEAINRLVSRSLEIISRESSPIYGNLSDAQFRRVYVEEQLRFLLGVHYEELLENVKRGKPQPLPFDKEELEAYSARTGVPLETARAASDRKVIAICEGNGMYIIGLSPFSDGTREPQLYKRILLDLLEARLGVPQYREDGINFTSEPHRFSLTRPIFAFQDFYASFALYDPPKALPTDAPLHSLAIVGLSHTRNVTLTPIDYGTALKVVQNNVR